MLNQFDTIRQLTSGRLSEVERSSKLNEFAHELGWRPSDRLDIPMLGDIANAHLLVEHGLEHTAIITFLKNSCRYTDLATSDKLRLLAVSYNNLVDWHIPIESEAVSFVYVRTRTPTDVERYAISRDNIDKLRNEAFEKIVERRPNPNIMALDDALNQTIHNWKRILSAELKTSITNENLSALFNAIIFARALEDQHNSRHGGQSEVLRAKWQQTEHPPLSLLIEQTLRNFHSGSIPTYLFNRNLLQPFDRLEPDNVSQLLADFYQHRSVPYPYDFSLMSKHALSRIYERYVSILRHEDESVSRSMPLFPRLVPDLPTELVDKSYGAVYTPQYIARFFAQYLREHMAPVAFKRARSIDPACGSGIFLRTMLELQCDPMSPGFTADVVRNAFLMATGWDKDENAVQATRLSLALLYLVLSGKLPDSLHIERVDAPEKFLQSPELHGTFAAVFANPPFVKLDTQDQETRRRVSEFMSDLAAGRIDLYLPFLKMGIDLLQAGGYGFFVLPHSFLISENAVRLRELLAKECWVRCLVDLSAVQVFPGTGIYIILLIFQKRAPEDVAAPSATIVKCSDLPARALQDAVEGQHAENPFYSIYDVRQDVFRERRWVILPPRESAVRERLARLPRLGAFLEVREGLNTGQDAVFVRPQSAVPRGEEAIYRPLLSDREMRAYSVPGNTETSVFYPYIDEKKLDEATLAAEFPKTYTYLKKNGEKLKARKLDRGKAWWEPARLRNPAHMFRPKIISPHLVLMPRFSVDLKGKYAVSRAPFLYPKEEHGAVADLLKYFIAVLNSTVAFWYISSHSHLYERGYVMMEPKTLKEIPVPEWGNVAAKDRRKLFALVDKRLNDDGKDSAETEKAIDRIVANLYGLSRDDRAAFGMEE